MGGARAGGHHHHRPAGGRFARSDRNESRLHGELLSLGSTSSSPSAVPRREPRADGLACLAGTDRGRRRGRRGHRHRRHRHRRRPGARAVDVWVLERRSADARCRASRLEPDAENAAERLAIRAIEVLRSSLVEIDLGARGQRVATVARESPAAPRRRRRRSPRLPRIASASRRALPCSPAWTASVRRCRRSCALGWTARLLAGAARLAGGVRQPSGGDAAGGRRARSPSNTPARDLLLARPSGAGSGSCRALGRSAAHGNRRPGRGARAGAFPRAVVVPGGRRSGHARAVARPDYLTAAAHVQLAEPHVAIHIADTLAATTGRPNLALQLSPPVRRCDTAPGPRGS